MSVDELLKAVDDLNETDVEQVFDRVVLVRARHRAPVARSEEKIYFERLIRVFQPS